MAQRNVEIDIMKGIAILCVMVGHTYWRPEWLATVIYSFHIPIFLLISGYFAKTREELTLSGGGGYVRKNIKQLLIPYAIAGVVSCGYALIRSVHFGDFAIFTHELARYLLAWDKTWPDTICDLWVAPVWFLLALFWARLFFYFLSYTSKWFIPLSVVLAVAMIMLYPYLPTPFCIGRGIEALLFMVIGWAYRKKRFPVWSKVIAIGCWFVSMYLGTIDVCAFQYNCLPVDVVGACGGTLVIYFISKWIAKSFMEPFFSWCGRNSLVILCAHSIEMGMTIIHVVVKLLPFTLHEVVYFGIKHGITLLGAWGYEVTKRKVDR